MNRNMLTITIVAVGASCLAIGYFLGKRQVLIAKWSETRGTPKGSSVSVRGKNAEIERLADVHEDFKMVLVVRNDLKMGKGKIAAQCSHATLGLYKKIVNRSPKALARWEMCGQVKVVTKTETEEELLFLQSRAKALKIPTHITIDAGRTQIAANSRTVMAILGPVQLVDEVTRGLKLL
ncbi:hypothetical protein R1sor_009751 [Riccia sorocarpa]|uniref:peptidyl-tRNA hydrolase n=1 Tax=Riccia sorocarpa TaxID=122646 RepID=A0ABD3I004_9MARC